MAALLAATGRRHVVTDNVLPRIGVVAPEAARAAIREAFLRHVIGGKGLSRGRGFAELVRAPTPDAVLRGVEVLADVVGGDVLVVDVGGATTDVYSVITPHGEDATIHREVVGTLWHARTVEADLGMRWSAEGVVEAAARERLAVDPATARYAAAVAADTAHLATSDAEWAAEEQLAGTAALVAVRRHGRPPHAAERPRPLARGRPARRVGRRAAARARRVGQRVLARVTGDHGGGWRVPEAARTRVDTAYVLFAVGLLADRHPGRPLPWRPRSPRRECGGGRRSSHVRTHGSEGWLYGVDVSTDWPWAEEFEPDGTYLNSATMGLPPRRPSPPSRPRWTSGAAAPRTRRLRRRRRAAREAYARLVVVPSRTPSPSAARSRPLIALVAARRAGRRGGARPPG